MIEPEVKLCVVCWKDSTAAQAYWYLKTIPVCDEHYTSVCSQCQRRWAVWWVIESDENHFLCDSCNEEHERKAARRQAYNAHLSSQEWRKTKKALRSQSVREYGGKVCWRCGMTELENKQTYGEGLHGHHKDIRTVRTRKT